MLLSEREFDALEDAQEMMGLIMSAYNDVVSRLDERQVMLPSTSQMGDLREWCTGFWDTMSLDREWEEDEVAWDILGPVLLVALEPYQENPETVREAISSLDDQSVCEAVYAANTHFKACRVDAIRALKAGQRVRRESATVGRNDPCPCGSGKKFKRCCLKRQDSTLH